MTTGTAAASSRSAHPPRVFRFLWVSKHGPKLRTFNTVESFSCYVHEVRALAGFNVVEFRTPVLAIGVIA